jgi:hypothetical protein
MMPIFEAAQAGRGQLFRIDRMAEVDKSQLVAGLVRQAQAQNFRVAIGTCQVDQQETPYYPWQQIFRLLFDLPSAKSSSQQVACLEALVTETDLEWLRLLPLLGELALD